VQSYGGRINNKEYKYKFSQTAEDAMAKIPTLAKISDLTLEKELSYDVDFDCVVDTFSNMKKR